MQAPGEIPREIQVRLQTLEFPNFRLQIRKETLSHVNHEPKSHLKIQELLP